VGWELWVPGPAALDRGSKFWSFRIERAAELRSGFSLHGRSHGGSAELAEGRKRKVLPITKAQASSI
jgi:hypothetical protein